jgi:hypothetical protein
MAPSIATFGRNLSNPLTNRSRSSTSAQNREGRSGRSEKNQDDDFFKFKESKKDSSKKDKSEQSSPSTSKTSERGPILGRVNTNNLPPSTLPSIVTPDGRIASAAATPITPGEISGVEVTLTPSQTMGANRKTSTDSFGSGGLGVMNIERLTGEQKAVGALVNKLLVKVSRAGDRPHELEY